MKTLKYSSYLNDCNCGLCELNVNGKAFSNVNKASPKPVRKESWPSTKFVFDKTK